MSKKQTQKEALLSKLNKELKKGQLKLKAIGTNRYSLIWKETETGLHFNIRTWLSEDEVYDILYTMSFIMSQEGHIPEEVGIKEVLSDLYIRKAISHQREPRDTQGS